jgi:hypothetical protein
MVIVGETRNYNAHQKHVSKKDVDNIKSSFHLHIPKLVSQARYNSWDGGNSQGFQGQVLRAQAQQLSKNARRLLMLEAIEEARAVGASDNRLDEGSYHEVSLIHEVEKVPVGYAVRRLLQTASNSNSNFTTNDTTSSPSTAPTLTPTSGQPTATNSSTTLSPTPQLKLFPTLSPSIDTSAFSAFVDPLSNVKIENFNEGN